MVENIFRELAARYRQDYNLLDVIRAAGATWSVPSFMPSR